jgi:undecaprenyl phosphate N,N'-diacetylbacillosamine 1-phosphate transferase
MIFKRFFDWVVSLVLLLILLLPMLIIALAVKIDSRGPAFFIQTRAGYKGKPFKIYKFRTMINGAEKVGSRVFTSADDPRVTKVGRFLRNTSIDEIPQLFNIIKGDMSLVGPRPTLLYQVDNYSAYQRRRLDMLPGITGWAQVNGRKSLTWPEKIELDIWYIENWSFWLDLKILFLTLLRTVTAKDIDNAGRADVISVQKEDVS